MNLLLSTLVLAALLQNGANAALGPRRLASYDKIAGYSPNTKVTDHNAIDQDQEAIMTQLSEKTGSGFSNAKAVYEEGGFSKSYAVLGLTTPLTVAISDGTKVEGSNERNPADDITGTVYGKHKVGDSELKVLYDTSDDQDTYVGCQVGALPKFQGANRIGCFATQGSVTVNGVGVFSYEYEQHTDNKNDRTIAGFTTSAAEKMLNCDTCPYRTFDKFFKYYGVAEYADVWIQSAFGEKSTNFPSGRGNANFSGYGIDGRVEAIQKGTAYMAIWMYVIREMEDAIDDCEKGDRDAHAWDEAVAFYTGSLEGESGAGEGQLLHALADKRCNQFKTCGENSGELHGHSKVNYDIFKQFNIGRDDLIKGRCGDARRAMVQIERMMTIPLVQGLMRYAYNSDRETDSVKNEAEGATFAAAVLPLIHSCSPESADTIYNLMKVGGTAKPDYMAVRRSLEQTYLCMDITCEDVGGLYNGGKSDYYADAGPCSSSNDNHKLGVALGTSFAALFLVTFIGIVVVYRRRRAGRQTTSDDSFGFDESKATDLA